LYWFFFIFCLHINCRISLLLTTKRLLGNLIGIALSLLIRLAGTYILTIMSFLSMSTEYLWSIDLLIGILEFELKAYIFSHSTSAFLWWIFSRWGLAHCPGWPQTEILLISFSWVDRIAGVSHCHPAFFCLVRWFN
jgi:hypothetical protein